MDGLSIEPDRPSRTARFASGATFEGVFFLGYFLLDKQKKVTGGHGCPTNRTRT
jgi:hypothetical protein